MGYYEEGLTSTAISPTTAPNAWDDIMKQKI